MEGLRALALQALLGLREQPPDVLIELAECHEYAVADCRRQRPGGCPSCGAKLFTAQLLRAVAAMRTAGDAEQRARAAEQN